MRINNHIPRPVLRRRGAKMTQNQFQRERAYQITLAIYRYLHVQGVLTAADLLAIDTIMLTKYRPCLGLLRAQNTAKTLDLVGF